MNKKERRGKQKKNETKGVVASMKRNRENPEYDEKKKTPLKTWRG